MNIKFLVTVIVSAFCLQPLSLAHAEDYCTEQLKRTDGFCWDDVVEDKCYCVPRHRSDYDELCPEAPAGYDKPETIWAENVYYQTMHGALCTYYYKCCYPPLDEFFQDFMNLDD